jgi:DHA1 family chloramphenicol resistance protein-like MFS transporter
LAPRAELRALINRRLLFAHATSVLAIAAVIVTFSYLSPLLIHSTGIASRRVPCVLALYGLGALAVITCRGRIYLANRQS